MRSLLRLQLGQSTEVLRVSTSVAGTFTERFVVDEGAIVAGLIVRSTSGSVTASIDTEADRGEVASIIEWPVQTAANGLLLKQGTAGLANHIVTVVTTGAAEVSVWVKPLAVDSPYPSGDRGIAIPVRQVGATTSPFGDVRTSEAHPLIHAALAAHIDDRVWDKYEVLGGTVTTATTGEVALTTSTTAYSYAALLSGARVAYRPGQAVSIRGTAAFSAGGANTTQVFGPLNAEEGVAVGRNGTAFGFLHRIGRRLAIYKLTLSAAATGAETVTITLNGTAQTVAVTAGTTTQNAREIVARVGGYADNGVAWNIQALGNVVYFVRTYHGATAGAFTLTSTGTCAGSFTQVQAGANGTSTWTPQADWNVDPMDGTGPSGFVLDPTKLTIYEFRYGWLGVLAPELWVHTGEDFFLAHRTPWVGLYAYPWTSDPKFPITYAAGSDGGTTSCTVTGASCYAELRGPHEASLGPAWSVASRKTGVGATEVPLLSLQCARVSLTRGIHNRKAILPEDIHVTNPGAKDAIVRIYKARTGTPVQLTGYSFTQYVAGIGCPVWYDTTSTAFTATSVYLLRTMSLPIGTSLREVINEIRVEPGELLIVTGQTASSTTELVTSIDGYEDI